MKECLRVADNILRISVRADGVRVKGVGVLRVPGAIRADLLHASLDQERRGESREP
ncbi:MAG: hypothetical protein ACE5IQ_11920 [Candidatus Methylomirabilales bacterium]